LAEAVCRREEKQESRAKIKIKNKRKSVGQSKEAVAQTQKRGREVDLCGGAFCVLIFWFWIKPKVTAHPRRLSGIDID
jgi:hypothetical protein